jgi:hypothetical protein
MAEVNRLGSTQFLKSSTRTLRVAGLSPADAKRKTEAISVLLLQCGFRGADLKDTNDGEEIVNLAEVPGGLGDKASPPNSPTAAEEYAKRGALVAMFKRMHVLPKTRMHGLKQGNRLRGASSGQLRPRTRRRQCSLRTRLGPAVV